tara:strand:- start:5266 stop:5613 length:348 start_codon:yes stop_codon:yes gene_type:complete
MLLELPLDIIQYILNFFDSVNYITNINILNKYFNNNLNDTYFKYWAYFIYGKEFWIKAKERNKIIAKPLSSMKLELLRLQNFINILKSYNVIWSNNDYYKYWKMLEDINNNPKIE